MAQFTCEICGDGFEQKSRYERHMAASHPKRAPSAADLEKSLSGIQYPKAKEELVAYGSENISSQEVRQLLDSLPDRTYRDAAEVAVALGEVKKQQGIRSSQEVAETEAPSEKGGKAAATEAVSAASVAKALSGVHFPKRKEDLQDYAQRNVVESGIHNAEKVIEVISKLPDREFTTIVDVEKSVSEVLGDMKNR